MREKRKKEKKKKKTDRNRCLEHRCPLKFKFQP